jgi:hypothetical protein
MISDCDQWFVFLWSHLCLSLMMTCWQVNLDLKLCTRNPKNSCSRYFVSALHHHHLHIATINHLTHITFHQIFVFFGVPFHGVTTYLLLEWKTVPTHKITRGTDRKTLYNITMTISCTENNIKEYPRTKKSFSTHNGIKQCAPLKSCL